jgi:hypothetical protein
MITKMDMKTHWDNYLKALDKNAKSTPASSMTTVPPKIEPRYADMTLNWQGVSSNEPHLKNGQFTTEFLPLNQNNGAK